MHLSLSLLLSLSGTSKLTQKVGFSTGYGGEGEEVERMQFEWVYFSPADPVRRAGEDDAQGTPWRATPEVSKEGS